MDVAGVRRRLRDVGTTVSGLLSGRRDEAPDPAPQDEHEDRPGPGGIPVRQAQEVRTVDETSQTLAGPDALLVAAVGAARDAARLVGGDEVGEHLGVDLDEELVATHRFATLARGYVGWHWAVTVARAPGSEHVTVDEVVLLPGGGAVVPPPWVPWAERVQPGDLSPGDLLVPAQGDARLSPSYADPEARDADVDWWLHDELGLGRVRVLSLEGRELAAERWWDGETGPDTPMAKLAPGHCGDCGFLVPLAGQLRQAFGACANAYAPDDGRVVALSHGCGAHSETVVDTVEQTALAKDHDELDVEHAPGTVGEDDPAEPLGHS